MNTLQTVKLPGDRKYPIRFATLIRITECPVMGTLDIRGQRHEYGPWTPLGRYLLREDPIPESNDRRFRLTKPRDQCECTGFLQYGRCKHLSALRALVG